MTLITCPTCGTSFDVKGSHAARRRFCSLKCKSLGTRVPIFQRLDDKYAIDIETGCWNWTGKLSGGYGTIAQSKVGPQASKELRAHRVMYEREVGLIPEGLDLDHLCRNRRCVNPAHLEPVTRRENLARGVSEHRPDKTHCKRGHELTAENTYVTRAGYRNCRVCHKTYERIRRELRRKGLPVKNVASLY